MTVINAKQLRTHLAEIVARVREGGRFTVLYRSRPAFEIVPVGEAEIREGPPDGDSLYRVGPVGASESGEAAGNHDQVLYG
jgi:prevent-host-death family protein